MNRNKRADMLVKEVLYIVLFILAFSLVLFPFGKQVFNSLFGDKDKMQAEASLDKIIDKINYMKKNNVDSDRLLILNPNKWYIFLKPAKRNELCICPESNLDSCNKGVCKKVDIPDEIKIMSNTKTAVPISSYDINFNDRAIKIIPSLDLYIVKSGDSFEIHSREYVFSEPDFKERNLDELIEVINYVKENGILDKDCNCNDKCDLIVKNIFDASKNYGISDGFLIVSLMIYESSCNPEIEKGNSVGLMQINEPNFNNFCKDKILNVHSFDDISGNSDENIKNNIYCGVLILKSNYNKYGKGKLFYSYDSNEKSKSCSRDYKTLYTNWAAALRGYAGWKCIQGEDDYVEDVLRIFIELEGIHLLIQGQTKIDSPSYNPPSTDYLNRECNNLCIKNEKGFSRGEKLVNENYGKCDNIKENIRVFTKIEHSPCCCYK